MAAPSFSMKSKYQQIVALVLIVCLVAVAAAGYLFYQYTKTQKELKALKKTPTASQKSIQENVGQIVNEVSKLMILPSNETPSLATISDISKLKDQAFFKNGKNGNILLVYSKASKAILYDPTEKKIVEVAPLGGNSLQQLPFKVSLRNGTPVSGLAAKVEAEIKKSFPNANIVSKDNAGKDTYEQTILVVLNQDVKDGAADLAKAINASVASLPVGENKPAGVDILIILGKDKI